MSHACRYIKNVHPSTEYTLVAEMSEPLVGSSHGHGHGHGHGHSGGGSSYGRPRRDDHCLDVMDSDRDRDGLKSGLSAQALIATDDDVEIYFETSDL